ncbi:hypothetical protein ACFUC1_03585 [Pedococcus sp. NPDC057267]|uniref:GlsB/YeaQ/YmgE family stress response membrane protein n=1 Tax=Pedococcus sp. NPDC057267 TaxID=3346077 RepID=UPI0036278D9F
MGDKDVDAQFADIIAHWDDVAVVPDRPSPERPSSERPSSERPSSERPSSERPPSERPSSERPSHGSAVNPPLHPEGNPTNPPPIRPFVVWRGVEPTGADDQDPEELTALEAEDDEHFEPGPVAPLPPQEDLQFWGIIVGLVAGPLLLLWIVLFDRGMGLWWTLGALGLMVGGFVLLVLRQPHSRDEGDPDNGARV